MHNQHYQRHQLMAGTLASSEEEALSEEAVTHDETHDDLDQRSNQNSHNMPSTPVDMREAMLLAGIHFFA